MQATPTPIPMPPSLREVLDEGPAQLIEQHRALLVEFVLGSRPYVVAEGRAAAEAASHREGLAVVLAGLVPTVGDRPAEHWYSVATMQRWRAELLEDPALAAEVEALLRRDFADMAPTAEELGDLDRLSAAANLLAQQIEDFLGWWTPTMDRLLAGVLGRCDADRTGAGYAFRHRHWQHIAERLVCAAVDLEEFADKPPAAVATGEVSQ